MKLELNNIKHSLNNASVNEMEFLTDYAADKLKLSRKNIKSVRITKKSVDARKKDDIFLVYTILAEIEEKYDISKLNKLSGVSPHISEPMEQIVYGSKKIENRPIIIGSGPAGLFAGLILAENGYKPLILERGSDVDSRAKSIEAFFEYGSFDSTTNIQFGEGGAGTFSDGKLTTRIKDKRCDLVLDRLVKAGAPNEILYLNKPHIGTDVLRQVVKNLRKLIIKLGGEVRFLSRVTDIVIQNNTAKAVIVNDSERIESDVIIAALGHSARDTYKMLFDKGVKMISKPFSIGVRIEHKQSMINEAQYGKFAGHPLLGAADYLLSYKSVKQNRTAYSFCMCPGGLVVAAASEANMLVTNGMSEYKRDRENSNSALVVSVAPEDFKSYHPLAGMEYQRIWEGKAFELGGGNYYAPVQLVGDFLKGSKSKTYKAVMPSYMPGTIPADLRVCLPEYVTDTLSEALVNFDRKIKGFASTDALMTGVETRTSAPIRIVRKENMESENISNLYPVGEGAGYAGGIMSAAVDGIKIAEKIIQEFAPVI
ncbi:MAG: NAD(P)/FAD-dependent oxidoreductase [Bacillota bacterium]